MEGGHQERHDEDHEEDGVNTEFLNPPLRRNHGVGLQDELPSGDYHFSAHPQAHRSMPDPALVPTDGRLSARAQPSVPGSEPNGSGYLDPL